MDVAIDPSRPDDRFEPMSPAVVRRNALDTERPHPNTQTLPNLVRLRIRGVGLPGALGIIEERLSAPLVDVEEEALFEHMRMQWDDAEGLRLDGAILRGQSHAPNSCAILRFLLDDIRGMQLCDLADASAAVRSKPCSPSSGTRASFREFFARGFESGGEDFLGVREPKALLPGLGLLSHLHCHVRERIGRKARVFLRADRPIDDCARTRHIGV
ncbi:hypothetical protein [Devosia sp.]|uniref:hypothetical protein n=1 Tax=Devosia sp. TaxID=1871048 RepID=UPI00345C7725